MQTTNKRVRIPGVKGYGFDHNDLFDTAAIILSGEQFEKFEALIAVDEFLEHADFDIPSAVLGVHLARVDLHLGVADGSGERLGGGPLLAAGRRRVEDGPDHRAVG